MIVLDSSVLVDALVGSDGSSEWSRGVVQDNVLVAPHLLPVEVLHAIRGLVRVGVLDLSTAAQGAADLAETAVEHHALGDLWSRVWELRENVTPYDAWYVALAEVLDVPLATLDLRLARAPGLSCEVWTPPEQ